MEGSQNINISGTGKINGGKFGEVCISGLGQILGDVEADRIEVSGMGTFKGRTKMQRLIINGNGTVEGELEGSELIITGNFKANGSVKVKDIRNQGRARFDADVKAENVVCSGYLGVGQNLETENFDCNGSFAIDSLLNANKVKVEINGFYYAREIGCEEIFVRCTQLTPWSFLHKIITPFLGAKRELDKLTTEVLEGTVINISSTNAKIVRGNDVRIGPDCNIGEVEYSGSLEVDAQAVVGKQTKII